MKKSTWMIGVMVLWSLASVRGGEVAEGSAAEGEKAAVPAGPVVLNAGFESWQPVLTTAKTKRMPKLSEGQEPADWKIAAFPAKKGGRASGSLARDSAVKSEGEASVRVCNELVGETIELTTPLISIEGGKTYLVQLKIRALDVQGLGPKSRCVGLFAHHGPAKGFWGKKGTAAFFKAGPAFDWAPVRLKVKTRAEDEFLVIRPQLRQAKGTAWFDDVKVMELP